MWRAEIDRYVAIGVGEVAKLKYEVELGEILAQTRHDRLVLGDFIRSVEIGKGDGREGEETCAVSDRSMCDYSGEEVAITDQTGEF